MDELELENPVRVDDEHSPQCNVLARNVDTVGTTDVAIFVRGQRKLQAADASLGAGSREPTLVRWQRIGIDTQYVAFALAEFRNPTADRSQFRRSDEGKIPGIKEQHEPAILVVRQSDLMPLGFLARRTS